MTDQITKAQHWERIAIGNPSEGGRGGYFDRQRSRTDLTSHRLYRRLSVNRRKADIPKCLSRKASNKFYGGEINPVRGRVDLQQYEALWNALNVIINPRGTVDRRPGLKFILKYRVMRNPKTACASVLHFFNDTGV